MAKTKNKTHNEAEHLNGIIKKQKSEIRNLKKRVKELERHQHLYEDKILDEEEPELVLDKVEKCGVCGKGHLQFQDFKYVKYMICNTCDFREKVK